MDITVTAPVFGIYGFSWLPNLEGFQILIQVFLNTFLPKTSSSCSSEALSFEASHSFECAREAFIIHKNLQVGNQSS